MLLSAFIAVAIVFVFLPGYSPRSKVPPVSFLGQKNSTAPLPQSSHALASGKQEAPSVGQDKAIDAGPGPLDPYASKVFLLLKSGATVIQNRLPPHIRSTLKRWPVHEVYADVETRISGQDVVDIIKWLPEELQHQHRNTLADYFNLRRALEENWIWELDDLGSYEGWALDRFKNVAMLAHAWLHAPKDTDWFFFMDMDTYVFQQGLLDYLKRRDPAEPWYLGRAADWETTATNHEGESQSIPFAHGGSGVALSRGLMAILFGPDPHADRTRLDQVVTAAVDRAEVDCCGDAILASMVFEHANGLTVALDWGRYPTFSIPFQGSNLKDIAVSEAGWCLPYYGWHHLTPREVDHLFDYEERLPKDQVNVTFAQIYKDFILPYVVPERESWDALHGHTHGYWEDVNTVGFWDDVGHDYAGPVDPVVSKEACKFQCENDPTCLVWVYAWGHCQYEKSVIHRGVSLDVHKKDFTSDTSSGWQIDRIRRIRARAPCDSLVQYANGTWNDDAQTSEGWFVRQLEERKQSHEENQQ